MCSLSDMFMNSNLQACNSLCRLHFQRVKKVIGIEMCKEAVDDARFNAACNGKAASKYTLLIITFDS